ncbi:3-alpha,7-alpha,12-alpha-trihydroxy-5-beta-choles t-24-enoyl-CoA hydratase [Desulfosarcina alkanivorans]|jgi:acyl dehydratase|uniref:3-alpha,7-alpha,12-alpha-trihydroxy-5-beta-choles t-24-enoyl-CoA hydratase n=1 Tax=Desulfosarcina alkanivorans TaxID=571177 RepID=A0A5K7YU36_9BACT|nr:MaoC/PaaZ C-terminal domain-containing protein [Desulfosarcina alkanivorans]BBO69794.1 3-alpha,7-alpha,12-alpha-trihydroxy-5-beta-choles t-24-enoyl-CoA hydratase [Desulfosarcina alkanivorans]
MSLNLDIVGKAIEVEPFSYDHDTVILYALGIGAGMDELDYIYEKKLKVFPTFAVVPFIPTFLSVFVPKAGLNLFKVLHGEQKIILHKPIAPAGTIHTSMVCESIYDKGHNGAVVNVHLSSHDDSGDLIFENRAVIIDRGAGGFGGERGPKSEKIVPPKDREPDFQVEYPIPPNQTALYRLSGDKNPLHIDPSFAKKGGFEKPILQGLCTYGYAGRAIVQTVCGGEPSALKAFSARFMNVVFPGETITVAGWKREGGNYIIQVNTADGRLVLGNALAELA